MNWKNLTIAVALWTLLLAPLFCGLGVVIHACVDDHASQCHHELECEADPCQVLVLAASQRNDEFSDFDDATEFPGLPIFAELVPASITSASPKISDISGLITELIEDQRTLPLIS